MRPLVFLLALAVWSGPAFAGQETALTSVGVLERNGMRDCSAFLIAPDLLATAGHCASGKVLANEGGEDSILFHTGAYPTRPGQAWQIGAIFVHPMFHGSRRGGKEAMRHDAAILRLSEPVPAEVSTPLEIDDAPVVAGERLLLATWPGGAGQRARERMCPVVSVEDGVLTLECKVRPGESGGAVLRLTPDGPRIVGMVVAQATISGRPTAIAVMARTQITQIRAIYLD